MIRDSINCHTVPQNLRVILWDFDGVIFNSMPIREWGFREIFFEYPDDQVERLIEYHHENGGLSRYVKIRYFFENILKKAVTEDNILTFAKAYSACMMKRMIDSKLFIQDSLSFIVENYKNYEFHIVSGSDQKELNHICSSLEVSRYFGEILGSPVPKKKLVKDWLQRNAFHEDSIIFIGDSINDYEAARENGLSFYGYNNTSLRGLDYYIDSFESWSLTTIKP
jgi:phosphoglycolate phosphatase-like HAD superfamily hydrolase